MKTSLYSKRFWTGCLVLLFGVFTAAVAVPRNAASERAESWIQPEAQHNQQPRASAGGRNAPRPGALQPGERADGVIDARFLRAYARNGGREILGRPVGFAYSSHGGVAQELDGGRGGPGLLCAAAGATDVYWLHGEIYRKYLSGAAAPLLQGALFNALGFPISDVEACPASFKDHGGRQARFQHGVIIQHIGGDLNGRTFEVHGDIYSQLYAANGGPAGALGYPVSDVFAGRGGAPRCNFEGSYATSLDSHGNYQLRNYSTPAWAASYAYQSSYPHVAWGRAARCEIRFVNTGTETWRRGSSIPSGGDHANQVFLGTEGSDRVHDHLLPFVREDVVTHNASGWYTENRILMVEDQVPPGGVATFVFWISPGTDIPVGTYREYFALVSDNRDVWFGDEMGVYWDYYVTGTPADWVALPVAQSSQHITLYSGQTASLWVDYLNLGARQWNKAFNQPWIDLSPTGPRGRSSVFYDPDSWGDARHASYWHGTNPLLQETPVYPTQTGRLGFNIRAPHVDQETTFAEQFEPISDSNGDWFGNDSEVWWYITVLPDNLAPRIDAVTFDTPSPSRTAHVRFRIDASDPETGVQHVLAKIMTAPDGSGNGTWVNMGEFYDASSGWIDWTAANPADFPDGNHRIEIDAWDYAGNRLGPGGYYAYFTIDTTPPNIQVTTTPTGSPTGLNNWYIVPLTVTLGIEDPPSPGGPGSGVRDVFYHWDSAPDARYGGPLSVPEGTHTLTVTATDSVGNSASGLWSYRVDSGPPDTGSPSVAQSNRTHSLTATYSGSDGVTSADALQFAYRLDGAEWSAWSRNTSVSLDSVSFGTHTFSVKARDDAGNEDPTPATTSFAMLPPDANRAPTAAAQSRSVASNTASAPSSLPLTLDAADADGDSLTFAIVSGPAHGSLSALGAGNTTTYTPTANYVGPDSFTFKASDGAVDSNTATVTLLVINRATVGTADDYTVLANSQLYVPNAQGVLANDVDPEGQYLQAALLQDTAHGVLHLGADGWFLYTPDPNFAGTDSFTYRVSDPYTSNGPVTVILHVPAAPVATGQSVSVASNTADNPTSLPVTLGASDLDGDVLTYSIVAGPAHGSLGSLTGAGVTYTPAPNYTGTDSFTFRATDGEHVSNTATVTLTVTNRAPTAAADSYSVRQNSQIYVGGPGLLGNDTDPEHQALHSALVSGTLHGSLALSADGWFLYTPATGYTGTDCFTYRAYDAYGGLSAVTTVTITVTP